MTVMVVTGYTPLGVLNMSNEKFRELGAQLIEACADGGALVHSFDGFPLHDVWLYRWLFENDRLDIEPARPVAPDRFKTMLHKVQSDCMQNQKMEWVRSAYADNPVEADVYVWIDYGVLKQQGMSKEVITRFIQKVIAFPPTDKIISPGLRDLDKEDHQHSWERFTGALHVIPRQFVTKMALAMADEATAMIRQTNRLWFETDTLVHLERRNELPFQHYRCWWGASIFENYKGPEPTP